MITLLTLQLSEVRDQRDIAKRQENRVIALLDAAAPVARRARRSQDEVVGALTEATALVDALRRTGSPRAIAAAGDLASALERSGAPAAIDATGRLARSLTAGDRITTLVDRATGLTVQLSALTERALAAGTVEDVDATRQIAARLEVIARRLDATTRQTRYLFEQSLTIQRSLDTIARETLRRVAAIDRRLGGS